MSNNKGVTTEDRLGKQLGMAAKAVQAHFDGALNGVGSSFHTFLVLRHIQQYPGVSQRVLADRLGIESPTLTHHLDRLVAEGLVERVRGHDDRRVFSAVLTADGRAHLRKVDKVGARLDAELRASFTSSELTTLQRCLTRITDRYGRKSLDGHHVDAG
jgi:DNA-binding MarR family transcriptional regulator